MSDRLFTRRLALFGWVALAALPGGAQTRVSWHTGSLEFAERPSFATGGDTRVGTVVIEVEVLPEGKLKQAVVRAGEGDLSRIVLESAGKWRFVPRSQTVTQRIFIYFTDDAQAPGPPLPPPPPFGSTLGRIEITGVTDEVREQVRMAIGIKEGDRLTEDAMIRVREQLKKLGQKLGQPLRHHFAMGGGGTLVLRISGR